MKHAIPLLAALAAGLIGCGDVLDSLKEEPSEAEAPLQAPAPVAQPKRAADSRVDAVAPRDDRRAADLNVDDADNAVDDGDDADEPAKKKARTHGNKTGVASSDDGADDADEPTVDANADVFVKRLIVAKGVEGREPVGAATSFEAGTDRIYAFVEVGNRDKVASEVYVSFFKQGTSGGRGVRLRVGDSPRWRTWSFTRLAKEPGQWFAAVKNAKGEELARVGFTVAGETQPATDKLEGDAAPKKTDDEAKPAAADPKVAPEV